MIPAKSNALSALQHVYADIRKSDTRWLNARLAELMVRSCHLESQNPWVASGGSNLSGPELDTRDSQLKTQLSKSTDRPTGPYPTHASLGVK